jgi:hypothetical protein
MSENQLEHRSVIKFLTRQGNRPKSIHPRIRSYFTIKFWSKQFISIQDDPRSLEAKTNENIKKVEVLVLADRRIRVSMITDEVGISETTGLNILHEDL